VITKTRLLRSGCLVTTRVHKTPCGRLAEHVTLEGPGGLHEQIVAKVALKRLKKAGGRLV